MFNLFIYILLFIVVVMTIIRTIKFKDIKVSIIVLLISTTGVYLITQIILFNQNILASGLATLIVPVLILMGIIIVITILKMEVSIIFEAAISSIFYIIIFVILPILILTAKGNSFGNYYLGYYDWGIMPFISVLLIYGAYLGIIFFIKNTLHDDNESQIAFKSLFIVLITLVSAYTNFYETTEYELNTENLMIIKTFKITNEQALSDDLSYIYYRMGNELYNIHESDENGITKFYYCVYNIDTQLNSCDIELDSHQNYIRQEAFFDGDFYVAIERVIYVISDGSTRQLYDFSGFENFSEFRLYIDDNHLYYENPTNKYEITLNNVTEVNDFVSIYESATDVRSYRGHLMISKMNGVSLIDGISYEYSGSLDEIQFFDGLVTNGMYEFKDGLVLPFGNITSTLYRINNEYYYKDASSSIMINVRDYNDTYYQDLFLYNISYTNDNMYFNWTNNTLYQYDSAFPILYLENIHIDFSILNKMMGLFVVIQIISHKTYKKTYRNR